MHSKSPPTGTPLAMRVTFTPVGLISFDMYIAVVSPSRLELVAMICRQRDLSHLCQSKPRPHDDHGRGEYQGSSGI